jgi:WhiB family redox-sensing transcriptional regulator
MALSIGSTGSIGATGLNRRDPLLSELLDLLSLPAWHAEAACREHPGVTWFPERAPGADSSGRKAKAVCRRCLVVDECRAWATEHDQRGIWGGITREQRRALQKGQPAP